MDAARSSLDSRIIPLLCDLLVRNPESVTAVCMQKLIDHYSASMDAIQNALNLLLGLGVQPGLLTAVQYIIIYSNFSKAKLRTSLKQRKL